MNGLTDRAMTAPEPPKVETVPPPARNRSGLRAFVRHLAEMLIAMLLGMLVLGGAVEGALALTGAGLSDASASLGAAVMAFTMTAPMVVWMRYRGHPVRHSAEMAASMVVPTAVVIALDWLDTIPSGNVMMVQHVVMIPAMVAVMLWRYDHYSR
jgi:hypothetical protein